MECHQKSSSAAIVLFLVVGALAITALVARIVREHPPRGTQETTLAKQQLQGLNSEPITRTVSQGNLPGSQDQARALMEMIAEAPEHMEYRITYQSEDEVTIIGCDLQKDVLVRVHQRPGGKGSQEVWSGHVIERLSTAADGGTLNDTPNGKIPGTFKPF